MENYDYDYVNEWFRKREVDGRTDVSSQSNCSRQSTLTARADLSMSSDVFAVNIIAEVDGRS